MLVEEKGYINNDSNILLLLIETSSNTSISSRNAARKSNKNSNEEVKNNNSKHMDEPTIHQKQVRSNNVATITRKSHNTPGFSTTKSRMAANIKAIKSRVTESSPIATSPTSPISPTLPTTSKEAAAASNNTFGEEEAYNRTMKKSTFLKNIRTIVTDQQTKGNVDNFGVILLNDANCCGDGMTSNSFLSNCIYPFLPPNDTENSSITNKKYLNDDLKPGVSGSKNTKNVAHLDNSKRVDRLEHYGDGDHNQKPQRNETISRTTNDNKNINQNLLKSLINCDKTKHDNQPHLSTMSPLEVQYLDSIKFGESTFRWLINPLSTKEFFDKFWETKATLIKRNDSTYFQHLASFGELDEALLNNCIEYTTHLDITSYTNGKLLLLFN